MLHNLLYICKSTECASRRLARDRYARLPNHVIENCNCKTAEHSRSVMTRQNCIGGALLDNAVVVLSSGELDGEDNVKYHTISDTIRTTYNKTKKKREHKTAQIR